MQPINAAPRTNLDPAKVIDLIQNSPVLRITYGCEWLDAGLNFVRDVSDTMGAGCTVSSDCFASIHRSCNLVFDATAPFNYVTDFVHPYVVLTSPDTGFSARFNLGVYTLQTPVFDHKSANSLLSFTGYDLLYYLDQPIGDSWELAVGRDPVVAAAALIAQAFPAANVQYEASGETAKVVQSFPFDDQNSYTYLQIVNALLLMVGYSPLWVDWDGNFQMHAFPDPLFRNSEFTFDVTASNNMVSAERSSVQDFFSVPNWWRFVQNNLSTAPVEGSTQITYVDRQPGNPGSYVNRGRYVKKTQFVDATSYAALWAQALNQITTDLHPAEIFSARTSPFPLAWHKDVFRYIDPAIASLQPRLSSIRTVQAITWTISLDGDDTEWSWQTVSDLLALQDSGAYPTT